MRIKQYTETTKSKDIAVIFFHFIARKLEIKVYAIVYQIWSEQRSQNVNVNIVYRWIKNSVIV